MFTLESLCAGTITIHGIGLLFTHQNGDFGDLV